MIPRDVAFHRAETITEAVETWKSLRDAGGNPLFYGGGTEIITLARESKLLPTDLVDIKALQETRVLAVVAGDADESGDDPDAEQAGRTGQATDQLQLGAALPLSTLVDVAPFPLIGLCAAGVADRTLRNSITLGGNICGMLPYREAILPLLLLDAQVESAGPDIPGETRRLPLLECFRKRLLLPEGALVVRFVLDAALVSAVGESAEEESAGGTLEQGERSGGPYGGSEACGFGTRGGWYYRRRTADSRIDYPITTVAMVLLDGRVRIAVSGTWGYPHRALKAEERCGREAGDDISSLTKRNDADLYRLAAEMVDAEDLPVKEDMRARRDYRRELTVQAIADGLSVLSGGVKR